jgi:UDP-glucose 4-epimerase
MEKRAVALVTGGAGFIGSHLTEFLICHGYFVRILDDLSNGTKSNLDSISPEDYQLIIGDISGNLDRNWFKDVEVIFHLAGIGDVIPSIQSPNKYMRINSYGTFNLLDMASQSGVENFIYAASSSCYGNANVPTNELSDISLMHPYALSKYLGEQAVLNWSKYSGVRAMSVCIFNAYGRRFKTSGSYGSVLGVFLKQSLEGVALTIVGDGSQTRDFVHIRDLCRAFYLALLNGTSGSRYNIGSGKGVSIIEIANLLGGPIVHIPKRAGEADDTLADITKAKKELGWTPEVQFSDGLRELIENIQEWKSAPLWTPELIYKEVAPWNDLIGKKNVL